MTSRLLLLFKLLRRNINAWQIAGFIVANLLGGIIILIGIQAYQDFDRFMEEENDLLSNGYMVVTKPITGMTTIGNIFGMQPTFEKDEIDEIRNHPAVSDIGSFTAANFNVRGGFSLGEINIATDMFMESVPDKFIDVKFDDDDTWQADVDGTFIPIIIPRKYLNIYNYGFAATKGLPQVGEGLSGTFPITIQVRGKRGSNTYTARIVGFTDRLNTVLVPDDFLKDANMKYMGVEAGAPSRLIVALSSEGDNNSFLEFIDKKGYSIEGNTESLKLQALVHGILWVVIGIGGIISILAFLLLLISILLLIEKNKDKFINLHSLGYTISEMASPYILLVIAVNAVVWILAAIIVNIFYPQLFSFFETISPDLRLASFLPMWLSAIALAGGFIMIHRAIILRQLKKITR